jgi:hypothetical protein
MIGFNYERQERQQEMALWGDHCGKSGKGSRDGAA